MSARHRILATSLILLLCGPALLATEALDDVELEELVLAAEWIVLGTAVNVETTSGPLRDESGRQTSGEIGSATLAVESVLFGGGDAAAWAGAALRWSYLDRIDPVSRRNPHADDTAGIYFLAAAPDGAFTEQGFVPASERGRVTAALARFPIRLQVDESYTAGGPVPVRLTVANPGEQELTVPGVAWSEGRLRHGPGFFLTVRAGAEEAPRRIGRTRLAPELAGTKLPPGEHSTVTVDLQQLFSLETPGVHVVEIEVEGFPRQRPAVFRLDPASSTR